MPRQEYYLGWVSPLRPEFSSIWGCKPVSNHTPRRSWNKETEMASAAGRARGRRRRIPVWSRAYRAPLLLKQLLDVLEIGPCWTEISSLHFTSARLGSVHFGSVRSVRFGFDFCVCLLSCRTLYLQQLLLWNPTSVVDSITFHISLYAYH